MNDPKKSNESEKRHEDKRTEEQTIFPREQQGERLWCLFQPLDDVELANYTALRNPLAEVGKSLGKSIRIVRTVRNGALSQWPEGGSCIPTQ